MGATEQIWRDAVKKTEKQMVLIERLAALEHEQWAYWADYMLTNMNSANIGRWRRQMMTGYTDLAEAEKDQDREWAWKVYEIFEEFGLL